jgi:NADH:ubiquinone oxidoreductase subunit 3 (subunit A)
MSNQIPKDQHAWNALFFILFPILAVVLFSWLQKTGGLQVLNSISLFDIVIMAFATFRLIHLIVYDKIFSFVRVIFRDTSPDGREVKPAGGFRRAVAELMECMWCVGTWSAFGVFALYILVPIGPFLILIIAISALASFMQVITSRIGSGPQNRTSQPGTCS